MKKSIFVVLCMFVLLIFGGCISSVPVENPKTTVLQTKTETKTTKIVVKTTKKLPVYVPGSIKLEKGGIGDDFFFEPTKRKIYYQIPGVLEELVYEGASRDLFEKNKDVYERTEMAIVTFVKHYDISRENFDKSVAEAEKWAKKFGQDTTQEEYELPNADIIYTFDNEIINEYYRRE